MNSKPTSSHGNETVLLEASFNQSYVPYMMIGTTIVLLISVVTIPILPIYWIFGAWLHKRQLEKMEAVLTDRSLKVKKGILFIVEKSVPLDKVTDLALYQGPIMRWLNLEGLRVETAGQSAQGSLVNLIGVEDARAFRDAVLTQRDKITETAASSVASLPQAVAPAAGAAGTEVLTEIRDAVLRIEQRLNESD